MQVREFGSFEEAMDAMAQSRIQAINHTMPWQWNIKRGDHWMRLEKLGDSLLVMFGHVLTNDELEKGEKQAGASQAEWEYTKASLDRSLADGFLYSLAFSVLEPDGDLGSTHASKVFPITTEEFETAKENKWIPGYWLHGVSHSVAMRIGLHNIQ